MSTIVAFEDLGKSCDKNQLEELIKLVQAKIEAAKKEKEKKLSEINNNNNIGETPVEQEPVSKLSQDKNTGGEFIESSSQLPNGARCDDINATLVGSETENNDVAKDEGTSPIIGFEADS